MGYAFTTFGELDVVGHGASDDAATQRPKRTSLSEMERTVIKLSLQDSATSVADLSGWRRTIAQLFGHEQRNRLANEPLEELRRFAVFVRIEEDVDADTLQRFLNAGYSVQQAATVIQTVESLAPRRSGRRPQLIASLVLTVLAAGIYVLVQTVVEEAMVSIIVAGLVFATMASIIAPREHHHR